MQRSTHIKAEATVVARVSATERTAIERLAHANDRTASREIRRAIRFYVDNFDTADRALRRQAVTTNRRGE